MQHPPESCGNPSRPLNPHSLRLYLHGSGGVSFVGSSVAKNDNGVYLEEERGPLGIAEHLDVPEEEEEAERNLEHPQVDRELAQTHTSRNSNRKMGVPATLSF